MQYACILRSVHVAPENFKILSMIKFFFYILFFGILSLIFMRLFDTRMGKWYMCFSLKDSIVNGITGKAQSGSDSLYGTDGTKKRKVDDVMKPLIERSSDSQKVRSESEEKKTENPEFNIIPDKKRDIYQYQDNDPIDDIIEKNF